MKKLVLSLVAILLLVNFTYANTDFTDGIKKNAIASLVIGIKSDNMGLKRNCIYFAGKYKIAETTDALIAELDKTDNAKLKVLIALSLYMIGEEEGIDAVYKLANRENDNYVKRMAKAIIDEYNDSKSANYASVSK
ncbi:hypothetical protein APF79_05660 [bacterium BRH_c32]|nr:MAG: hypothetical protein APF79_05660 [bacterium BRH_c32]